MRSDIRLLNQVRIEKPCPAAWEEMTPIDGERVRHCSLCQLNVHNLSAMSRSEAEELLRSTEGRLCVQYTQCSDGTILTTDTPWHLYNIRVVALKQWAMAASVIAALSGLFVAGSARAQQPVQEKPTEQKAQQESVKKGEIATMPKFGGDFFVGVRGDVSRYPFRDRAGNLRKPAKQPAQEKRTTRIGRVLVSKQAPKQLQARPVLRGKPVIAPQPKANPQGQNSKESGTSFLGAIGTFY